jgi:hypothetical protein
VFSIGEMVMATKAPETAEEQGEAVAGLDVAGLQAQLAEMQEQVAALTAAAQTDPQGGEGALSALTAALERMQAPSVTVQQPKQEPLPPRHDEVEEGFDPVRFQSKGRNFKVLRVSAHRDLVNDSWVPRTTGRYYDFGSGGQLLVHNSDVAEYLRSIPQFNRKFWELGNAPGADKELKPLLRRIATLGVQMDAESLEEIVRQERRRTNPRSQVLTSAMASLEAIQGLKEPEEA